MNFGDLKNLIQRAELGGLEDSAPVMFILETEDRQAGLTCSVKSDRIEFQSDDGEGNVTSVGGTLWLYGNEY